MAALATIAEVRSTGGLPESSKLPDAKITEHLAAAARELKRWLGDYSGMTGDDLANCKEAECCIAMSYLLPVLNVICPEAISTIQKEYGELEMNFLGADDLEKVCNRWMDRAKRAVSDLMNDAESTDTTPAIGWNVI